MILLVIVQGAGGPDLWLRPWVVIHPVATRLGIVMADDVKEFVDARLNQISLEKLDPEIQKLKKLLDSRNKDDIIRHLSLHSGPENFEVSIIQS